MLMALCFSIFSGSLQILCNLQEIPQLAELLCDSVNTECAQLPIPQVKGESEREREKETEGIGGNKKKAREAEETGKMRWVGKPEKRESYGELAVCS